MSSTTPPKRFALLVGVDFYMNDGSRRSGEGEPLSLPNLRGCVNDVRAVAEFLRDGFQLEEPRILTSSLTSSRSTSPTEPPEPVDLRPTFDNIKKEFDTVTDQASPGDLFLFHFSGHGAELQPTSNSPPERPKDPSLMTMDFCIGKPAIRGWQLNEWLKRLNEKNIRTIVILDSCHSGGAWRADGSFRTPEGWKNVPNLPADEEAITETAAESGNRDVELETSWSINPDGFTLMAACESHEKAAEKRVNGSSYGTFTYNLLASLERNRPTEAVVTYRNLRDQIAERIDGQSPRVYGRDRLVFFGDKEPISATPLVVRLEAGKMYIPLGRFHGFRERSEFTTCPPTSHTTFKVDHVYDWECSAPVPSAIYEEISQQHYQVVPCRWSLRDDIKVLAHPSLGSEFQEALKASLQDLIVGNIEIIEANDTETIYSDEPNSTAFGMIKHSNERIDVFGSTSLTGYEGPVRGLDLTGVNFAQRAAKSSAALAHLARFKQILDLRNNASRQAEPFEIILRSVESESIPSEGGQWIEFVFRNTTQSRLDFTVLDLSSGFHVKQIYPLEDSQKPVDKGGEVSFEFKIKIPDPLKDYEEHRDIIRILVTSNKPVSWKSLELPDVWNANQLANKAQGAGRDAETRSKSSCWVRDIEVWTKKQSRGDNFYWVSRVAG